jgi:hypothetical protein
MNFIKWLVTSSSDPQKVSLTVKGALAFCGAYLLQLSPVLCGFHIICISIDGDVLTSAINTTANIVYLSLSLVGSIAFLVGLGRKIWMGRWSSFTFPQPPNAQN